MIRQDRLSAAKATSTKSTAKVKADGATVLANLQAMLAKGKK